MFHVRFAIAGLFNVLFLIALNTSRGDEKRSPLSAAEAVQTIARFIDEDTIAVAHVDASRIDLNKLFVAAAPFFPAGHPLLRLNQAAGQQVESFLKAGGRDLYVAASVADLPERGPFVLVPLGKSSDEQALRALGGGAFVKPPPTLR